MSDKPIVALDLDGTLLDMASVWCAFLEEKYGKALTHESIKEWDLRTSFGLATLNDLWEHTWDTPLKPYKGATDMVWALQTQGFDVRILSNRESENALKAGLRDVHKNFPGVVPTFVAGSKKDIIKKWAPAFFLDDRPANLFDGALGCPRTRLLLLDRPWNQSLELNVPWRRLGTYYAILGEITGCSGCAEPTDFKPRHNGSVACQSGSIGSGGEKSHCTCDVCF